MLDSSIKFVVQSIEKSPLIEKNNIFYQKFANFLDKKLIDKINQQIDSLKKTRLEKQLELPRERAEYNQILLKELKILFSNSQIRKELEKKYTTELKVESVDIWFDYENYYLSPHIDDKRIKLSLQIYLGTDEQPGTILCKDNIDKNIVDVFSYKYNCGYSMLNNTSSYHALEYPVKQGVRKSLYVRFN